MRYPTAFPKRFLGALLALSLAAPTIAVASTPAATYPVRAAAMAEMVQLAGSQVTYQTDMMGSGEEIFEGVFTNPHPEAVENLMLLVKVYSHPDEMLMDQYYVPVSDDYIVASGGTGTYRVSLPMRSDRMYTVTGPFGEHGMSIQKALTATLTASRTDADGTRRYVGTVVNDSPVGVALSDIIVSGQEQVGGAFFGQASDTSLFDKRVVLASGEATSFELVGMRPGTSVPVLTNLKAQGKYQTLLNVSPSTLTPAYGTSVALRSTLMDSMDMMLPSLALNFLGSPVKSGQTSTKTMAAWSDPFYSASVKPSWAFRYRAEFPGDTNYARALSSAVTIKPRVYLTTPAAATTQRYGSSYSTSGYLKPRHTSGTSPVRIYRWKLVSGSWKPYGYASAKVSNYSSYSKYATSMRMPSKGKWRIRVVHATDSYHTKTESGYRYITVR